MASHIREAEAPSRSRAYLVDIDLIIKDLNNPWSYWWQTTITVCLLAILARCFVDIDLDLSDHFVGNPDEVRNCLTVDALIPKFTFSGNEPDILANFILFNWEITTPTTFPFSSYIGLPLFPGCKVDGSRFGRPSDASWLNVMPIRRTLWGLGAPHMEHPG